MKRSFFALDPLTRRERQVLAAVRRHIREQRVSPTRRELADALGISAPTVHQHLKAIEQKGHLTIFDGQWRGVFPVGARVAFVAATSTRGERTVLATRRTAR